MAENRRDQSLGRSEQQNSGRQEQQSGSQNEQTVGNSQSGSQWDNYRTKELSAGDSRSSRNSESEDTDIVESGLGIDE